MDSRGLNGPAAPTSKPVKQSTEYTWVSNICPFVLAQSEARVIMSSLSAVCQVDGTGKTLDPVTAKNATQAAPVTTGVTAELSIKSYNKEVCRAYAQMALLQVQCQVSRGEIA